VFDDAVFLLHSRLVVHTLLVTIALVGPQDRVQDSAYVVALVVLEEGEGTAADNDVAHHGDGAAAALETVGLVERLEVHSDHALQTVSECDRGEQPHHHHRDSHQGGRHHQGVVHHLLGPAVQLFTEAAPVILEAEREKYTRQLGDCVQGQFGLQQVGIHARHGYVLLGIGVDRLTYQHCYKNEYTRDGEPTDNH